MKKDSTEKLPSVIRDSCGTHAGYHAHQRNKETRCEDCYLARKAWYQKWSLANPERDSEHSKKWNLANPEKAKANRRAWKLANPEAIQRKKHRARALRFNAESEPYTTQDILNHWGVDCHICHEPIDLSATRSAGADGWQKGLHLDHVVPLSGGGSDLISNVRPAHGLCNLIKGTHDQP